MNCDIIHDIIRPMCFEFCIMALPQHNINETQTQSRVVR